MLWKNSHVDDLAWIVVYSRDLSSKEVLVVEKKNSAKLADVSLLQIESYLQKSESTQYFMNSFPRLLSIETKTRRCIQVFAFFIRQSRRAQHQVSTLTLSSIFCFGMFSKIRVWSGIVRVHACVCVCLCVECACMCLQPNICFEKCIWKKHWNHSKAKKLL